MKNAFQQAREAFASGVGRIKSLPGEFLRRAGESREMTPGVAGSRQGYSFIPGTEIQAPHGSELLRGPGFTEPMGQPRGRQQVAGAQAVASPVPTATPAPGAISEAMILQGLQKAGFGKSPIAQHAPVLAEAAGRVPQGVDPYLPTILSLMETGGLKYTGQPNNPYNIFYPGTHNPVQYQSVRDSIFGPQGTNETLNLLGLLRENGPYQHYLDSGNLSDFFMTFTPPSDPRNPSNDQLVERYNLLRSYF